jgi:inorganic pyrophosphatase
VLTCRPIGVIEGEQGAKKDKERNDRIVAAEQDVHSWADIKTMDDLGKEFCRELEEFFVNYHSLVGGLVVSTFALIGDLLQPMRSQRQSVFPPRPLGIK